MGKNIQLYVDDLILFQFSFGTDLANKKSLRFLITAVYFLLQDKWSAAYDCRTILLSIQSLLGGLSVLHELV